MAKSKASKTTDKIVKNDMVDSKVGKNSTALSKKPQEDKSEIARQKRLISIEQVLELRWWSWPLSEIQKRLKELKEM